MNLKLTFPDGWQKVTLSQFQEIAAIENDKAVNLISILSDEDPELIRKIDNDSYNRILEVIDWAFMLPSENYKTQLEIDGVKYGLVKFHSLSLGEWVDIENHIGKNENLHKLFAILYRPFVNEFDIEEYDADKSARRAELFKEKLIIADVYGALVFFSLIEMNFMRIIKYSLEKELKMLTYYRKKKERKFWRILKNKISGVGTATPTA